MRHSIPSLALLSLLPSSLAAPAPITPIDTVTLKERQLLSGLVAGVVGDVNKAISAGSPNVVASALANMAPVSRPSNIADAMNRASQVWASPTGRTDLYSGMATQVAVGLGPLDDTLKNALTGGLPVGENSDNNNNAAPKTTIYPKKEDGDAPYTFSEDDLRKAIYIPSGFTYGAKRPVLMIPGTGAYGGSTFSNNIRKLLTGQSFADPVWLNVPNAMLAQAQNNDEYVAYAINYIASITSRQDLAIVSWSQGGLATQWVLKYWPSTRKVVGDFFPVSPDFKGTALANLLCLSPNSEFGLDPCPPSVVQQEATSKYIKALRSDGGDSAYVPTTTFYSGFFDEIVEPQQGTKASAYLSDARGVGVSNNEVQTVCAGKLAGTFYGHAGVLFNPLVYALIADGLQNAGPGRTNRIDLASVCNSYAAPGLDLDDVLSTLGLIPTAGVLLLTYPDRRVTEPTLPPYAS